MFSLRFVVFLLLIRHWVAARRPNYVYQKDVSEYCRRRAIPSVFLSRHVADANAEMLYFTKLDLPYNCFISIRTETSSHIIMVIQLTSGPELEEACRKGPNQLLVYEFGETFGGYWGPMPEAVISMNRNTTTPRQYTLRTSRPTATREPDVAEKVEETTELSTTTTWRPTENADFIKVEVPLMNLSGNLVPGVWSSESSINAYDDFDTLYDVTPRSDETYLSSIVPLMQFSVNRQTQGYRYPINAETQYELDYNGAFTLDKRLTMMHLSTRSRTYRNRNLWKPKRPKAKRPKNAPLFNREVGKIQTPFRKNYDPLANEHDVVGNLREVIDRKSSANKDSFKLIQDLMQTLNKSNDRRNNEVQLRQSYLPILKNISDTQFNSSAYLIPWSVGTLLPVSKIYISRTNHNSEPRKGTNQVYSTNSSQADKTAILKSVSGKVNSTKIAKNTHSFTKSNGTSNGLKDGKHATSSGYVQTLSTVSTKTHSLISSITSTTKAKEETKVANSVSNTRKSTVTVSPEKIFPSSTQSLSGSLVDHESWENVVQVAPAIAGLLNQIAPLNATSAPLRTKTEAVSPDSNAIRKRRSVAPIPILSARPHAHRTSSTRTYTERTQRIADTEHFAQLVELPDDEMRPRVALRFMRQYAGQVLFDICQQYEADRHKLRHLVLFNSSRIILALRNYTISRMTVVVTSARTLRGPEPRCPDANVECQVGGTRVCIDETSACDGIPNCGALDIYDEDRLECGAAQGLLHNVYLAAFTFLALLLTGLYIVHYWLQRCVPGVADAFFVYTDGTENALYLDTIMRSPTDLNIRNKSYGESSFQANMYPYSYEYIEVKSKSFYQRFRSTLLRMIKFKRKHDSILSEEEKEDKLKSTTRKMYSFAELEIQNISRNLKVDEEVQTGESLEMAFLKMINSKNLEAPLVQKPSPMSCFQRPYESPRITDRNESMMMKSSVYSAGPSAAASLTFGQRAAMVEDEKELEITLYDPQEEQLDEDCKVSAGMSSAQARKRLRFDQKMRLISAADVEEVKDAPSAHRHSVALPPAARPQRRNIHNLDIPPQDQESSVSDIRGFFKVKKIRKKNDQKIRF